MTRLKKSNASENTNVLIMIGQMEQETRNLDPDVLLVDAQERVSIKGEDVPRNTIVT